MKKSILFLLSLNTIVYANALLIERNLGKGGVSLAQSQEVSSVFFNPANLSLQNQSSSIVLMNGYLAMSPDSMTFIRKLVDASRVTSSEKNKRITDLLNENIGKPLHITLNNFSYFYDRKENFSWLVGLVNSIDASFVTHTGFGSLGAMESHIDEYHALATVLNFSYEQIKFGIGVKAINKYQILHNYSTLEMLEIDSITEYFDNEYKQQSSAMALDLGVIYPFKIIEHDVNVGISFLNIGNTSFDTLGTMNQTINMGFSIEPYEAITLGLDYMDLFNNDNSVYASDNFRLGLTGQFLRDNLEINCGVYNQEPTFGVNYKLPHIKLGFDSYVKKGYNNTKSREYGLNIAYNW